jgi:altronate dehydratase
MKFLGFKRKDGSVGVRNHVLILPSCACASETCRVVASQVLGTKNVIINVGCSDVTANTEMTQRVLTGFALNANVFGVVVIGLGCETVGHKELADKIAGQRIVKQNFAHPVTENQKQNRKNKAKKQSVQDCFFYRSRNLCVVVCTVGFRDSRK